jgi:hypothetical protein
MKKYLANAIIALVIVAVVPFTLAQSLCVGFWFEPEFPVE